MYSQVACVFAVVLACASAQLSHHGIGGGLVGGHGHSGGYSIMTTHHHTPIHIKHEPVKVVAVKHEPVHLLSLHHGGAGLSSGGSSGGHHEVHYDYYAEPKYHYKYGVEDKHTGDIKEAHEERNGDKVQGYYSLKEADGTTRIVKYTADKHNGFNAVVERHGHAVHPQPHPYHH